MAATFFTIAPFELWPNPSALSRSEPSIAPASVQAFRSSGVTIFHSTRMSGVVGIVSVADAISRVGATARVS